MSKKTQIRKKERGKSINWDDEKRNRLYGCTLRMKGGRWRRPWVEWVNVELINPKKGESSEKFLQKMFTVEKRVLRWIRFELREKKWESSERLD
jgi:hypothetical protein